MAEHQMIYICMTLLEQVWSITIDLNIITEDRDRDLYDTARSALVLMINHGNNRIKVDQEMSGNNSTEKYSFIAVTTVRL